MARVATSADEAKAFGYFRRTDGVSFDRARLLAEAKSRAIAASRRAAGTSPALQRPRVLPGESGMATLQMMITTLVDAGQATAHDAKIGGRKAGRGPSAGARAARRREVTEDEVLEIEREAFPEPSAESRRRKSACSTC